MGFNVLIPKIQNEWNVIGISLLLLTVETMMCYWVWINGWQFIRCHKYNTGNNRYTTTRISISKLFTSINNRLASTLGPQVRTSVRYFLFSLNKIIQIEIFYINHRINHHKSVISFFFCFVCSRLKAAEIQYCINWYWYVGLDIKMALVPLDNNIAR